MAPTLRSLGNTRLSMLNKPRALTSRAEFAADIKREWSNALEATVQVGRRLNEAKAALPHGQYEAMIATDLPFSASTARKLREIAAFVDSGKVPLDQLPEAMSTLYAIATLPDETRQQALDQGVIRPDTTRAELASFKPPRASAAPPSSAQIPPEVAPDVLGRRWSAWAPDPGAIVVELEDGKTMTVLVVVANDPAAADIVRHVVRLHNAGLRIQER